MINATRLIAACRRCESIGMITHSLYCYYCLLFFEVAVVGSSGGGCGRCSSVVVVALIAVDVKMCMEINEWL